MTSRPSASVFITSTVVPLRMVITSVGRWASPPIMFSARHSSPMTSTGTCRSASAVKTARIAAAPPMSPFMAAPCCPMVA